MNNLKVFQCDDSDMYAAESAKQAEALWHDMVGDEPIDEDYPRELTDAELDKRWPKFTQDGGGLLEGETTSIREMLAEHGDEPGWLAGSDW